MKSGQHKLSRETITSRRLALGGSLAMQEGGSTSGSGKRASTGMKRKALELDTSSDPESESASNTVKASNAPATVPNVAK